jgi:hypothetical protein
VKKGERMAARYLLTGVQIGMLQIFFKEGKSGNGLKLLNEIEEKQFVGNSPRGIDSDIKLLAEKLYQDKLHQSKAPK